MIVLHTFKISALHFFRLYTSGVKSNKSTMENIPTLYGDEASPPVRFVLMTASILNTKLNYHHIDLFNGDQKKEFYKKINPLQKVPALVIQGHVICDSHAICVYLCQKKESTTLYPNDAFTKAKINEMLFFHSGTLFPVDSSIFTDYFAGKWPVDQNKVDMLNSALDHLEFHLAKNGWLTGDEMRLCDVALMATVTSVYQVVRKTRKHKNIDEWLNKFEKMPVYEINRRGLKRLKEFVEKYSVKCHEQY